MVTVEATMVTEMYMLRYFVIRYSEDAPSNSKAIDSINAAISTNKHDLKQKIYNAFK